MLKYISGLRAQIHFFDFTDDKPAVLVVLHCTNDPECVVPESSRAVSRDKMIAVDFLFSEDYGLHKCEKNKVAMCKVVKWLKTVRSVICSQSGVPFAVCLQTCLY